MFARPRQPSWIVSVMADKYRGDTSKPPKNPLLSAAGNGFPFENFSGGALLMPISQSTSSIFSEVDAGEVDSFLGQPTSAAPSQPAPLGAAPRPAAAVFVEPPRLYSPGSYQSPSNATPYRSPFPATTDAPSADFLGSFAPSQPPFYSPQPVPFNASNAQPTFPPAAPPVPFPTASPQPHLPTQPLQSPYPNPSSQAPSSYAGPPTTFSNPEPTTSFPSLGPQTALSGPGPDQTFPTSAYQSPFPNQTSQAPFLASAPQTLPSPGHPSTFSTAALQSSLPPTSQQAQFAPPRAHSPYLPSFPSPAPTPPGPYPSSGSPYFVPSPATTPASGLTQPADVGLFNPGPTLPPVGVQYGGAQYGGGEVPNPTLGAWTPQATAQPPPPPPTAGAGNSYRLGSQKRLAYAPLPGLAVSPAAPLVTPAGAAQPLTSATHFVPAAVEPAFTASTFGQTQAPQPTSFSFAPTTQPSSLLPSPVFSFSPTNQSSPILTGYDEEVMSPTQSGSAAPRGYSSLDQTDMVLPPSFNNLLSCVLHLAMEEGSGSGEELTGYYGFSSMLYNLFSSKTQAVMYRPVYHHWFYRRLRDGKFSWVPFSMADSMELEKAFISTDISPETKVSTDGGRYDVSVLRRQRSPVYWDEPPAEVRRCSWFSKGPSDASYVPYEEGVSTRLEEEFKAATSSGSWHRRVDFPSGEAVVLHGPNVIAHFPHSASPDTWGNTPPTASRPRVVKRGVDEFEIDEGEPEKVDALLFLVHGIGSACDLRFRNVEEVGYPSSHLHVWKVNDFRTLSLQLVQSHFRESAELGAVSRVEVLPVSWHGALHGEDTGIDRKLKSITLHSIPKLRDFTNDTLLDILFYTSPVYCQTIMETVGTEMNRLYSLFTSRNPSFTGAVSVSGHSLGSLIVFDLLCHQTPEEEAAAEEADEILYPSSRVTPCPEKKDDEGNEASVEPLPRLKLSKETLKRRLSQKINYVMGQAGTGQPFINYPQLNFQPKQFFALGSPIGMFVTIRGMEVLGEDFHLPTCPGFFNIFHPFDPVAYRIETLINPEMVAHRPVLIPHHKGRKRMHLELKETMARVGADLKQRLVESVRSTWNTVYQYAMFHRNSSGHELEHEVDKVLEEQMAGHDADSCHSDGESELDVSIGRINGGRRVDFVLQEAPLESFNEYLSAILGHLCYWESEDTMLMILKEMYGAMGITPDSQTLQHQIPLEPSLNTSRIGSESRYDFPSTSGFGQSPAMFPSNGTEGLGMDPTAPIEENRNLGPPPTGGFVRKM